MADKGKKGQQAKGASKSAANKKGVDELGKVAVKEVSWVAALTMKGANPVLKIITFGLYIVAILGILALIGATIVGNGIVPVISILVGAVLIAVILVIIRYQDLSKTAPAPPVAPAPPAAPDPPAPATPTGATQISTVLFQHIRSVLESARKKAFELIQKDATDLQDENVRANIFLPEYLSAGNPGPYVLKIYPGLHINMTQNEELHIVFQPGQGATGVVFQTGQPRASKRLDSKEKQQKGNWDSIFKITPELDKVINPQLQWIMSMPLKIGNEAPLGVMNIDGLKVSAKYDTLYKVMPQLTMESIAVWTALKDSK